jgi:hypothetical protein
MLKDQSAGLKNYRKVSPGSVPAPVVSRNPDFIQPFNRRDYTPGIIPSQPLPHPDIASVLRILLEDFS